MGLNIKDQAVAATLLQPVAKESQKIVSIQYLRGLAALGVVLFHYSASLVISPAIKEKLNFGQHGVEVFFLISGFIIIYSLLKEDYKVNQFLIFLLKRSIRIDPAYYVTVVLAFLLYKYFAVISPVKGTAFPFIPQQFAAHLFYLIPFTNYKFYISVFWTLCVEFQFYLLIGILYFITDNKIYQNAFLVLFCLSCFINIPKANFMVFGFSSIFAAGIALVTLYKNKTWPNAIMPLLFLIVAGCKHGVYVALILAICCLIILYLKYTIRPLLFLGKISYSLYLTHNLIDKVLLRIVLRLHYNIDANAILWLFTETVIAITFAYFFYLAIEKPSLACSKRFFYRKTNA